MKRVLTDGLKPCGIRIPPNNAQETFEVSSQNLPNDPHFEALFDFDFSDQYRVLRTSVTPLYFPDDLMSPALIPPREVYLSKEQLDLFEAQFRSYLSDFVQAGKTPFITPHLYQAELPPILQDAYLVCSAYLNRTPANMNMIFSILSSKVQHLISTMQSCSVQDQLASLQAMILYQIIRLFDGNIRQRSIAEAQLSLLDQWTAALRLRHSSCCSTSFHSSPYHTWLSGESIRRTILMSIFLQGVYGAIKRGYCDRVPDMAGLPLTLRGDLWEIDTENEWLLATQGYEPLVMSYHDFTGVWSGFADVGIEAFQKVLLVACLGEEGLRSRMLDKSALCIT